MTVYTFDYSTEYDPPGPIVEFQVSKAGHGARYVETRQMRGIVGLAYPVDLYLVSIRIGVHPMPAVRVIAGVAESEAIIGRDVLNHLVVTLNGLASVTEIGA
jgi:hypothetical protein